MSEEKRPVEPSDPLVGNVVADRYRIERRLGEGGMGVVYLARHVILEKIVALKVLHQEYARRRELVERFLHEAKAASRIRHEHVIDITDFGETPDRNVFFAMEYLDGHELATELAGRTGIAWPRAKSIILQICSALQAAHEANVIHRDLKPENIYLIQRLGHPDFVKVLDFGVAKLIDEAAESRRLTKTGMVFGTPEYMSPEQAKGDKPDPRVDVYACGCILFEMVTGDVPYRSDSFMGVLTKHLLDKIPRLAERTDRGDLPPGLQDVLDQAMAKDRDQRFGNMNELAVAIDTLDEIEGVTYLAPGAVDRDRARSRGVDNRRVTPAPPPPSPPIPTLSMPPNLEAPVPPPPPPPPPMAASLEPLESHQTVPMPMVMDVDHLPRRRMSKLTMGAAAGVVVALAGAAVALMSGGGRVTTPTTTEATPVRAEPPAPTPAAATPPPEAQPQPQAQPEPPKPEPAAAVTAPPPAEPKPEPAAAAPPPEPVVAAPPPEPAAFAPAPPPPPATKRAEISKANTKRPRERRVRERDREKRPPPVIRVAPIPTLTAPPPRPIVKEDSPPSPPPAPPQKKSDLKDPFGKK